ncbi:MAG: pyridoxamine 5'-phosphate oxidase family protein [Nitrososphaerota archaeon]|nr:pyridoxamine 5'-phosphate oxidase family protein [Nitrososphaerota archaeon]
MKLSKSELSYARKSKVAHLATVDSEGNPHLVPVVFAATRDSIYLVVDRKTKKKSILRRLENIVQNGKASFLIDKYSEDWSKLSYLMLSCQAEILGPGKFQEEKKQAARLFKRKYSQYSNGKYFPSDLANAFFVRLLPPKAIFWQNLHHSVV